jgi:transcriptional regulator with XRE-family HTH domain
MKNKLGEFVRAHRERIGPEIFGLPNNQRRRTPGLRREELASLCGVSSTWITWLEQGRPVSASAKTLSKLAEVLRLSAAERKYLFGLSARVDPEIGSKAADAANAQEAKEAQAIVNVVRSPAYVLDRQWNAVAWNAHAARLFAGWLGPGSTDRDRNLLGYMFLQPAARKFVVDWPDRARRLVAEFRADCGKAADAPPVNDLIDHLLRQSKDFAKLWAFPDVVAREGGVRRFLHPEQGRLTFHQISLQLQGRPDLKVAMLLRCAED